MADFLAPSNITYNQDINYVRKQYKNIALRLFIIYSLNKLEKINQIPRVYNCEPVVQQPEIQDLVAEGLWIENRLFDHLHSLFLLFY